MESGLETPFESTLMIVVMQISHLLNQAWEKNYENLKNNITQILTFAYNNSLYS